MYIVIMNNESKAASTSRAKIIDWVKENYDGASLFVFQKIAFSREMKVLYKSKILGYIREIKVL